MSILKDKILEVLMEISQITLLFLNIIVIINIYMLLLIIGGNLKFSF